MKLFFLLLILNIEGLIAESLPAFKLADQNGKIFASKDLKNHTAVLLGCFYKDITICRKVARKIYWSLQNKLDTDRAGIRFLLSIDLRNSNFLVEKYIDENKNAGFESVLLDRKGVLADGLKENQAHLRIFSKSGKMIFERYFQAATSADVASIYKIFKSQNAD
ncbi:MAG: hypothetical protein K8R21_01175 [Leptospira sp.]|nr:hypothetical protein [Leptospira sp.]